MSTQATLPALILRAPFDYQHAGKDMAWMEKTVPISLTLRQWDGSWSVYLVVLHYWLGIRGGQCLKFGFKRILSTRTSARDGVSDDSG